MHIVFGIFLVLHGLVHLLWFVVPWGLMQVDGLPYNTTIMAGRMDVGDNGIRFVGLLWVIGTLLFVAAGVSLLFSASWWAVLTIIAALFSLFLNILGWPDSRWSALINVAILAFLTISIWQP